MVVHMTVGNTDKPAPNFDPVTATSLKFDASDHRLHAGDQSFNADSPAALALGYSVVALYPGDKVDVALPFDVPTGTAFGVLEVHDSAFSNGAKIGLQQSNP
jgi:hypothetical protein